jgi:uncharacterized protein (TIGR02270 family)
VIPDVVRQHVDDTSALYEARAPLVTAPHAGLRDLSRVDDRLAAHLDGLAIAGEHAWPYCRAALASPSAGAVFTIAVRTIAGRRPDMLDELFAVAQAVPESAIGLISAFGWVEREQLQGVVVGLLGSQDPFRRMVGIAACGMHRVDPGLKRLVQDADPAARARGFRTIGDLGLSDEISTCAAAAQTDEDRNVRFWAACSAVLLGHRGVALDALTTHGLSSGAYRARAFRLAVQAMTLPASHALLQRLAEDPHHAGLLIRGSGVAGDPMYVPWLIRQMADVKKARLAGEAFSLITGVDLPQRGLDGSPPENFESGPTDDSDDPNVDLDEDDGLPWPDGAKVEKWWAANDARFQKGVRHFMGGPATRERCVEVLKTGHQRQRILAAHYLSLLEPGTPLFNTSAPALRQQRRLAKMS